MRPLLSVSEDLLSMLQNGLQVLFVFGTVNSSQAL